MQDYTTTLTHRELLNIMIAAWFTPGRKGSAAVATNDTAAPRGRSAADTADTPDADTAPTDAAWVREHGAAIPFGLNLLVWDEPGTGKTSAVELLGWVCGFDHVQTIALNNRAPEDVGGYAVPNKTRTGMTKLPDGWVDAANGARRSLVVFDEFTVDEDRQAAALRVFSERMAGEFRILPHVRTVALANPPMCAATPNEITPPNANRFGHCTFVPFSEDEFGDWLIAGAGSQEIEQIDPDAHEARILAAWPEAFGKAAALVKGYLRRFPHHLHQMPKGQGFRNPGDGEEDNLRWASRRIWENVARAVASAECHGLTEVETDSFIGFFLPAGIAAGFNTFRREQDIPEPRALLTGNAKFRITPKVDRTFAVLEMCAGFLANTTDPARVDMARVWWGLAAEVLEHTHGGKDFVVPSAKIMARPKAKGGAGLGQDVVPEAAPVVTALYDVLAAERDAKRAAK